MGNGLNKEVVMSKNRLNLASFGLITYLAVFILCICVTQDDYATLSELTLHGFFGPTIGVWSGLGGNISSVLPRTIALSIGVLSVVPIGLVIYSAITLALILLSFSYLLEFLIPSFKSLPRNYRLPILLVLALGFEGLFTPGQLGVLGFSAAAGVHIWPICLIVIGHKLLIQQRLISFLGASLALLYASNSNVPEGLVAILVLFLITYRLCVSKKKNLSTRKAFAYLILCILCLFALVAIFAASGFQARTEAAGVSFNVSDLVIGVSRAAIYFSVDVVTHPFLYLSLILGYFFGKYRGLVVARVTMRSTAALTFLYFLLLVAGAGVAYPAWHQTFGLYVMLLPIAFAVGVNMANKFPALLKFIRILLTPVLIVCLLVTVRSGFSVVDRKLSWNENFQYNVCVVYGDETGPLRGSEITYPPKDLGIEDVNTWPWMADGFKTWITKSNIYCKE